MAAFGPGVGTSAPAAGGIWALGVVFGPWVWYLGLGGGIWASAGGGICVLRLDPGA